MVCYKYQQLKIIGNDSIILIIRFASAHEFKFSILAYYNTILDEIHDFIQINTILLQVLEIPAPKITALEMFQLDLKIILTVKDKI